MHSVGGLGGKYAVGKMAEIMITCNEVIFKLQEDVQNVSREVVAVEGIPAVCTSRSTCFANHLPTIPEKTAHVNRSTSLLTPPVPKHVRDLRFRKLHQKLMDLERVGRLEWLKVFMCMSSHMEVLPPVPRGEWDEPKKLVQRQTITLDGPYPGIPSDLIVADNGPSHSTRLENMSRKPSTHPVPKRSSISVRNVELEGVEDYDNREFLITTRPCPRRPSIDDPRRICDCLGIAQPSSTSFQTRRKQIGERRPNHSTTDYKSELIKSNF